MFVQNLAKQREKIKKECLKCEKIYFDFCNSVHFQRQKNGNTEDEKLKISIHQEIIDMNNAKNNYLLKIKDVNASNKKYRNVDIPAYLLSMREFGESVTVGIQGILKDYLGFIHSLTIGYEHLQINNVFIHLEEAISSVFEMRGKRDVEIFLVKLGRLAITMDEYEKIEFKSCGLWKDNV